MTLSRWLRDYLYIPLGGSRKGTWMTYRNLMLTMLLGGLWHGAAWTFVAWGASHGTGRLGNAADVFGAAVREASGHVRSADPRLLGALAWWTFDASVLWAMLHAFGAPPPFAVVVLAYFVGQVGNTIPIPGAVSGGIVGVLVAFQVPADLALVSVLAYRSIAIWLPAPIGLVALGSLRRTMTRWSAEDAGEQIVESEPHAAPAPVPVARTPRPCHEPALLAA